jgi:vancomycin resistance protein VanJ
MTQRNPSPHRRIRISLTSLCWAVVNIYGGVLIVYLLLHILTGTRLWPVALAANFSQWLLLPTLILLPFTLWRRRWTPALLSGMSAAAFGWLFGGLFLPQPAPTLSAQRLPLTVMTFNVNNGHATPDRLNALIRDSGAAIVGLEEVNWVQAAALPDTGYPYQVVHSDGTRGIALLSQYPILEHDLFYLESHRMPHLRVVLDVDGTRLTVIVAHPPPPILTTTGYYPDPLAAVEIATLADMAANHAPAILMGDFNTSDQSDSYALLPAAGLTDAFRAAGWGFGVTWPARRKHHDVPLPPLVRIDYIWLTSDFRPVRAWVGPPAGSDHLPVVADLVWEQDR